MKGLVYDLRNALRQARGARTSAGMARTSKGLHEAESWQLAGVLHQLYEIELKLARILAEKPWAG